MRAKLHTQNVFHENATFKNFARIFSDENFSLYSMLLLLWNSSTMEG